MCISVITENPTEMNWLYSLEIHCVFSSQCVDHLFLFLWDISQISITTRIPASPPHSHLSHLPFLSSQLTDSLTERAKKRLSPSEMSKKECGVTITNTWQLYSPFVRHTNTSEALGRMRSVYSHDVIQRKLLHLHPEEQEVHLLSFLLPDYKPSWQESVNGILPSFIPVPFLWWAVIHPQEIGYWH